MASSFFSARTKTILYWVTIVVLFALFVGFLIAYITKPSHEAPTVTEAPDLSTTPLPTEEEIRLGDTVRPKHYALDIRSDHEQNQFSGTVKIDIDVSDTIDLIKIHCKNLDIISYDLIDSNGTSIKITNHDSDDRLELCNFILQENIPIGSYTFTIGYNGTFKAGQITGFYKSSYTTLDNQVRYLTATKFEPTYARMAFPCFDEPHFKAEYDISITHPSSLNAISNEIEQQVIQLGNGWSKTTFKRTVPMSTYLVAFVVSDFKFTETKSIYGTRVRVYSRPDQVEKTRYATETAAKVLHFYENYTGIPYTLTKLDLIGLPEFVSGAMENWGLVTYKENYVLYSESESSATDMKQIAAVISHELTHMWFGNLVTLKWWNDLWLNEGFASYIEYKGQDYVNKSWNMFDLMVNGDLQSAMRADSLESAHPVVTDVLTPNQITAIFDTFSYSKGASILYVIENIIGPSTFQQCARNYLNDHKFGVVDTPIFIKYFEDAIKKAINVDIDEFFEKYLYTNSYPILTVKRSTVQSKTTTLNIVQTRYGSNQSSILLKPWIMEIPYFSSNGRNGTFILNKVDQNLNLNYQLEKNEWFKLNKGSTGYYVVNYESNDWQLLMDQLKNKPGAIPLRDRANLLFDANQLATISLIEYETLFGLFDYLKNENEYLPWSVANTIFSTIEKKLKTTNSDSIVQFKAYIRELVNDVYDSKVDFNAKPSDMTYNQITLRNVLISLACRSDYEKCTKQANILFQNWLNNGFSIDPNIRSYVYKYGLKASTNDNDWERVWDKYQAEKDALEKSKLMSALTSTTSSTMLLKLIKYSTDQNIINNQNFFSVQQNIASNSDVGRDLVWNYIKNNWEKLVERFTLNDRRLGNYVKSVTSGFGTEFRLIEMEEFFKRYPDAGAGAAGRIFALESVRKNIQWAEEETVSKSLEARDQYTKPWLNWRLDEMVIPSNYDVNLTIDVDQEIFFGTVSIDVNVQQPIRNLILHSKDLQITSSNVYTKTDNTLVSVDNAGFNYTANQFWIIPMAKIISNGQYVARLTFSGKLSTTLSGLYLSSYISSETGKRVKLATTQFQAGYARKAFPCFDEPFFKAQFTISITHRSIYSAISNMPVNYVRSTEKDWTTTVFQRSVRMSTYLVAMVVSDFSHKTSPLSSDFSVYTFNPKINLNHIDYALNIGPRLLNFYANDYFKIPYPLPKTDMIAVPDFSMGAMENWGLVTYRDVYVLFDPASSTSASKMSLCSIVAHELAHMWYGNLVTIKWWNDLWLNEGFAQFMMYKATAHVEPTWNYTEHFVIKELSRVFDLDSSLSTHSILTEVKDENDMQSIFDPVTYAKGSSIIRMLENTIGEENFRTAVTNYLKKYSYKNTVTNDLWQEFSNIMSGQHLNVDEMMDSWIRKEGFPVVTINTSSTTGNFTFKQERFLKDFSYSNSTYTWFIPLTYRIIDTKNPDINNPIGRINFNDRSTTVKISEYNTNNLIKFNVDQTGVYIINYTPEQWKQFIDALNDPSSIAWKMLSTTDRSNLLSDAFYLSRSGRLSYDISLNLAQFLRYEKTYVVWSTAYEMLGFLRTFAISQDKGIAYNHWLKNNIIGTLYDELGWDAKPDEDLNRRQLRVLILNLACLADHEDCLNTANKKFGEYKQQIEHPSKNIKRSVPFTPDPDTFNVFLYHTMRTVKTDSQPDVEKFNFIMKQYETVLSTNEKMRFLRALSAVQNPQLLKQLVDKSLNTTFLRAQDYFSFLVYVGSNPIGLDIAWKSYRDNFQLIQDRFGLDESNLGRAVYRFASYFNSAERRKEVTDFYEQYPIAGASELYRQQALELIDANVKWSTKFYDTVIEHLTKLCDSKICPWNVYRLTDSVQPQNLYIDIQINTNTYLYNGTATTLVNVIKPVNYIILHAAKILKPSKPSVQMAPSSKQNGSTQVLFAEQELSTGEGFRYGPLEFYVIPLKESLKINQPYLISVYFEGNTLLGGNVGLYRGWYEDKNVTVNIAATQFESTHARKVFPCFDEPHFKQIIYMTITHETIMNTTLSNMPIKETKLHQSLPGWSVTTYEPSVKMVTYLIAILVSNFQCSSVQANGIGPGKYITISTCASNLHSINKHNYSLKVTPSVVKHYETFLKSPYQLLKIDQVALPQFAAGAMENWGLIKYREKMLLWAEDDETSADQRSVAAVIAHELAHMWFGNLVTCDFWGELWLNEAFASYMEFSAVSAVHPDWNYFDTIAYYDQFNGMVSDSTDTSQPIVRNVTSPSLMDYSAGIVYNKGSSILHMINNTMGNENFQKSLQSYLEKNKYTSAVTQNLFDEFSKNWPHKQDINEFLRSWTYQPGFPYLNITYNDKDKTYSYSQERFIHNGVKPKTDYIYVIPFSYYTMDAKTRKLQSSNIQFLSEKTGTLPNDLGKLVKVNPGFNSFYLVNYPENVWKELSENMLTKNDFTNSLMVNDRAELFVSSFYLARAKLTSYLTPFKLFNYLVNEKHFIPWYFYDYSLTNLAIRMDRTEYRESLMQFERRITLPHYEGIDFWNDSIGTNMDKSFRQLLITITCRSGNPQCLSDAYTKFTIWKNSDGNKKNLPPNLRENILCYAIRYSQNVSDYEFVWEKFISEKSNSPLKTVYMKALSFISNSDTMKQYIDKSLNETAVSAANFVNLFNYVIQNYDHEIMAWKYFTENYSMLSRKLNSGQIESIVTRFATYYWSPQRKEAVSQFMIENMIGNDNNRRATILSRISENIAFMNTRKVEVGEWLTQNACGDTTPAPCPWGLLRIDKMVSFPKSYNIVIQVNVTTFVYNGTVEITVETKKDLDFITLNAASMLTVNLMSVTSSSKSSFSGSMFRYHPQQYIVIRFDQRLKAGEYILKLNYTGNLIDGGLSGLYLSNYTAEGQSFGIASTQFEFYDARKVFPCFDEPTFKSKFSMTIIHDKKMNATLSNMEIDSKSTVPGKSDWIITKYKQSPPMTSYLVAMMVSDFVCRTETIEKTIYGVCASRTQQNKMDYALTIAPKSLQHLESVTGIKYPLNKVDLLAIPDFYYGAMENWGLITFRESALLYSADETTSASKINVASIIAHELAHFWFGNLVTCEWWDNLFLNEAFATYMEYTTVNSTEPDWNYFDMFLISDFEPAINTDSVDTVHAVLRPISATLQIDQFTSNIVYAKGASILRMTEYVMKTENFYSSIRKYLQVNQYKNVRSEDLFLQLDQNFPTDQYKMNSTKYLNNWIKEKGFPYINVTKEDGGYRVHQQRFLLSPTVGGTSQTIWNIPFSFYTDSNWSDSSIQFLTKTEEIVTPKISPNSLIKFNAGHNGFYLVNYSPDLWNQWIDALVNKFESTDLPPIDRAGLILDSFHLARGNLLSYTIPLKLARYLTKENHITPWTIAIRGLDRISKNVILGSDYREQFEKYCQDLVKPIYTKLGWNDNDGTEVKRKLRATILDFACSNNYQDCLEHSSKLFNQWKNGKLTNDKSTIPSPNLLSIVLKYGLKADNTTSSWLFVWSEYLKETSVTLKSIYLTSLANTLDQNSITMLLNQAMDAKVIRAQDSNSVFSAVLNSKNTASMETLWQFYRTNYLRLAGPGSPLRPTQLSSILNGICSNYFFTADRKSELQSFFSQIGNVGLSANQRLSAINTIDNNIDWLRSRMIEVENFLLCNEQSCPFTIYRLNKEVSPKRYDLDLNVDLENDQFHGTVSIDTTIGENSRQLRYLTVSAASTLNITSSKVVDKQTKLEIPIIKSFAYKPYEFWVLELKHPVNTDSVLLQFEFNSKLSTDMYGFYRSEYYDPLTQKSTKLASTQFQDIFARRAFPCFDEPSFKSVFHVKLTHQSKYNATMSNNKILKPIDNKDGTITTEFEDTPPMVTYLLAFIVSDFYCDLSNNYPEVNVRVCSTPPQKDMIQYALSIAPPLIETMAKKYNNSYQLPKMDLVAIPDFAAGAMENWGILTFRETALLWNKGESSADNKVRVAATVAHEITHMWFGNQVTCQWWSDLWINEAFATFMEWFSVATVEPDWNYKQLFYVGDFIAGMNADASKTAHPLVRNVVKPSEVNYISNIIYQKGSSVLRMFESVLTEDEFFNTLGQYLQTNKYKSVPSSRLLDSLAKVKVQDLNTTEFVYSWAMQPGIPYLNITTIESGTYQITQERFFSTGRDTSNTQKWIVPLTYYKNYQTKTDYNTVFIQDRVKNVTIKVEHDNSLPIKFNQNSIGYYVVNYPNEEWKKWIIFLQNKDLAESTKLTEQDLSQLMYDSFALSGSNLLSYEIALELTEMLRYNEMYSVWTTGEMVIGQLWPYFRSSDTTGINALMQSTFRKYVQTLVQNNYGKYGLQVTEPVRITDQRVRVKLASMACAYGFDTCLLEAQVEYKKWQIGTIDKLSPNVRPLVVRYAIQESNDDSDWHYLWKMYQKETQTNIKLDYLQGLAQTSNRALLKLLFERANEQSLVRRQDYLSLYSYVLRTQIGYQEAWNYFTNNYKSIRTNRLRDSQMGTLANYFARYLNTEQERMQFQQFFVDHPDTGISTRNLNQALETIGKNINWSNHYRQIVYDWMRNKTNSQDQRQL